MLQQDEHSKELAEDEKFKITILLAEYNTLRSEAIARGNHFYQIALGGGAVTFVIGALITWVASVDHMSPWPFWISTILLTIAVIASAFVLTYLFALIRRDLNKAVQRVRELEIEINERQVRTYLFGKIFGAAPRRDIGVERGRFQGKHLLRPQGLNEVSAESSFNNIQ